MQAPEDLEQLEDVTVDEVPDFETFETVPFDNDGNPVWSDEAPDE